MFRPVGLEPLTSSSDPPHTSEHPIPTLQRALQVPNQLLHRPPVLPYLRFANRDFATWNLSRQQSDDFGQSDGCLQVQHRAK
ncbi:hypothetical protein KC359_g119 [Hortaea werneckii]|nr:hypothetical protein KC359_g119 [Hortaea werneckii]